MVTHVQCKAWNLQVAVLHHTERALFKRNGSCLSEYSYIIKLLMHCISIPKTAASHALDSNLEDFTQGFVSLSPLIGKHTGTKRLVKSILTQHCQCKVLIVLPQINPGAQLSHPSLQSDSLQSNIAQDLNSITLLLSHFNSLDFTSALSSTRNDVACLDQAAGFGLLPV